MPTPGDHFTRKQILALYQHDPSDLLWVVFRGRQILALCLRFDYNRSILQEPAEVWVGADSPTAEWGDILANDTARVPVYVKQDQDDFTYLSEYAVLSRTATAKEIQHAKDSVPHNRGISRIVFLKKASNS